MSKHIPRAFVEEVLARSDIVEIINSYVSLRKAGKDFVACCPFHEEKTPSFTVSQEKQFYYCFGCGAKGNAITFLMEHAHLSFVEAVQDLASRLGLEIPYEGNSLFNHAEQSQRQDVLALLKQVAQFYQHQLRQHPERHIAVDYLQKRGLSGEIAAQFGLGFAPDNWDSLLKQFGQNPSQKNLLSAAGLLLEREQGGFYDRFRQRIMFPIQDKRGDVIGFGGRILGDGTPKYLNSPETLVFHKGQELYGLYAARAERPQPESLLVVEGYMDVLSLAQFGVRNVVATLGTATSSDHLKSLFRVVKRVVFCFDGDKAGYKAAWRALETVMPLLSEGREARFMFLPDGEDPDTLVRQEGKSTFQQRIEQAQSLAEFLFQYLSKQLNLNNLTGQMQLLEQTQPLLEKMPEGPAKQLLRDRLGAIDTKNTTHLAATTSEQTAQHSQQLWQARLQGEKQQRQAFRGHLSNMSPMRTVVGLLLQYPTLIEQLPTLPDNTLHYIKGGALLVQLVDFLHQHPQSNTGMILEHWRDNEYAGALHKLASWQHQLPETGVQAEFHDAVQRLQVQAREQAIEALLQKSRLGELNAEEKQTLRQLIH